MNSIYCNGEITLEPRLQEYVNKLRYYKNNNIAPCIDLEREFQITSEDRVLLKQFLSGNKNVYGQNFQNSLNQNNSGFVQTGFQSNEFKNDPRFARLQKKLQRDREANQMRYSYGNNNQAVQQFLYENNNQNFTTDEQFFKEQEDNLFLDSKPYMSDYYLNVKNKSDRVYHYEPQIQYKQRLAYKQKGDSRELPHAYNLSQIITELDTYRDLTNTDYQNSSYFDMNTKVNTPAIYSNNKRNINTSKYQAVPFMKKIGGQMDVDVENKLMKGLPDTNAKFKSIGYPNPSEHYFDYISNDMQKPEHTVLPFARGGESARLLNDYKRAKPYIREIY